MASIIRATTTSGLQIAPDNSGSLILQTNGTTAAVTVDTSQNTTFAGKVTSAGALTLASNGTTTALTIDTSQNVGIGTSSPTFATGTGLQVKGAGFTSVRITGASSTGVDFSQDASANGYMYNRDNAALIYGTNNTERMRIDSSGGLILAGSTAQKATGTTWSNPSDQRLKDNIRDYTKGTAELMQVRVREWEYNGKGGTTEGMKGLGVIADEVMTILPNTVETYDAKLNADDEETTAIKKFDATEITWLLVKTVQEQQTIINDLKARVETLEAK